MKGRLDGTTGGTLGHQFGRTFFYLIAVCVVLFGCSNGHSSDHSHYHIIRKLPHDRQAYTQGLLVHNGYLYESTGQYGRSTIRKVDLETGRVLQQRALPQRYFGEGLVLTGGVFVQLTWRAGKAFVYNSDTFELVREFNYDTEGWGLTTDGTHLIMSDGSSQLYFRDPLSFKVKKTITVRDKNKPAKQLNELEYIKGEIWANIYLTNDIVRIAPDTGEVLSRLNFNGLLSDEDRYGGENVLNGIAYDAEQDRIYLTGKLYAYVYEIKLSP